MIVGIPRELFIDERRVAFGPAGVRAIAETGATVYIEHDAGAGAGWSDREYEQAGATIAYSGEEVYHRADLVVKVLPPSREESALLHEDQVLMSYLQLPLARREVFSAMVEQRIIAIGLENIENERGHPMRRAMSEIAGAIAVHNAAHYLQADVGGRGVLIGGIPGVPPASVGIIGAGVVGTAAAEAAMKLGAHVILTDQYVFPLRNALRHSQSGLQTALINQHNLEKLCRFVDVLIGAVLIEDYPAPHMISREMIRSMKPRSVFIDVAIDQGGISETSHPTTISNPVYVYEEVIHYCVPNIPAIVPRTATRAFQNHVLPLVCSIIEKGVREALRTHPFMSTGLNMYEGIPTREVVARAFDTEWKPVAEVLK